MFAPGAVQMLPGKTELPLLVNHDRGRQIGVVKTITRWEDPAHGPSALAVTEIHEHPCWLRRWETPASFCYKPGPTNDDYLGRGIQVNTSRSLPK